MAVSVLAYGLVGAVPYLASGLVAPPWGVALLLALWAAGWWPLAALLRRRSWLSLSAAPAAVAVWVLVVFVGDILLGWTA